MGHSHKLDPSAYPTRRLRPDGEHTIEDDGMTLRDYFAAAALTGFLARGGYAGDRAKDAYMVADRMMKQRDI